MKSFITLFLALVLQLNAWAQCTALGPVTGNIVTNSGLIGSLAWYNLSNILLLDNNYASVSQFLSSNNTSSSNYIMAQGFNFSVPDEATICGIQVDVSRRAAGIFIGASVTDNSLMLLKNSSPSGSDHASPGAWPTSKATASYGGSSDTWGTSWTPADINSSAFGVALSSKLTTGIFSLVLTAHVDQIRVTVYYYVPLPVELEKFSATPVNNAVQLSWSTASEINNSFFTIERSVDTLSWSGIVRVEGAGTSSRQHTYEAYDRAPLSFAYYRLKQTDVDGNEKMLRLIAVHMQLRQSDIVISPNPADRYLRINSESKVLGLQLIGMNGGQWQLPVIDEGNTEYRVSLDDIPNGQYALLVITGEGEQRLRCMIAH